MIAQNRFKKISPEPFNLSRALFNMCLNYSLLDQIDDDQLKIDLNDIHDGLGEWFEQTKSTEKELLLNKLSPFERKILGF